MATYPAPTETLTTFNPAVFETNDVPLTITEGSKYFLKYPLAQGAETFSDINVAGVLKQTGNDNRGLVFGYNSSLAQTGTTHNTAFGNHTMIDTTSTTRDGNSAFGELALTSIITANNNTGLGHNALRSITSGSNNTQVGMTTSALAANLTTASNNTLIGHQASVSGTGISGATAIGKDAQATVSNDIVLGTMSNTVRYQQLSPLYTTVPTYTTAHIGYTESLAITYPTTTTNVISMKTVPAGVWLFQIMLNMNGGPPRINIRNAGTLVGFVLPSLSTTYWYNGLAITNVSTGTATLDCLPAAVGAIGTDGTSAGQYVKILRIA